MRVRGRCVTVRSSRASWCAKGGHGIQKTYTAGHARAHGGPNRARGTRTTPCLFTPTSGAQPAPARRAYAPTRQGVVPRAESSALAVPQLATLAAWGCAFSALGCARHSGRALKPPRAQGPEWKAAVLPRDPAEAGRFHGVPRARRRMYWVTRRSRNASRRAQPPYTAASRLQTRCTCDDNAKGVNTLALYKSECLH